MNALLRTPDVSLRGAWALWSRNAAIYRRTYKLNILPNFFEPLFYLVGMGIGLGAYLSSVKGTRYIDFIAPGLVATAALFGASFEVTFNCFVKMEYGKTYDACMATPLTIEDVGLGELLWATTRSLIYGSGFMLVASPFGVFHSWWGILAPFGVALIGMMFAVIGLSYCAVVPIIDYFSYWWTIFMTPMFLFAGTFFPLERLPGWVRAVSWLNPLRHGVDLMRALLLDGNPAAALRAATWIAVVTTTLFVLPLNLLHRRMVK